MPAAPHYDFAHATAALIAIAILLSGLALLAVKQVHEQVRVYAVQSVFAAGYTLLIGVDRGDAALIGLAALTAVIKVIVIPIAIDRAVTRQVSEHEVPLVVQVPMSLLDRRDARGTRLLVGFRPADPRRAAARRPRSACRCRSCWSDSSS